MDETLFAALWADRQRELAWVNENAWKFEHATRRSLRTSIANAFRALAARIAPVTEATTEPAVQQ